MRFLALSLSACLAFAIDNGLAQKPGLGWNSDYCQNCSGGSAPARSSSPLRGFENEAFFKQTADFLVSSGLASLGYTYVNSDSLWDLPTRDANGDLQPDPALWPSGITATADYLHARGLGFGVYGDRGNLDCNRMPGNLGHEVQDAALYARLGVDWYKSDSCYASSNHSIAFTEYAAMRDALNRTGRPIWFALCGWATWYAWEAPGKTLGNSWRTGVDTGGGWAAVMSNVAGMVSGGPNGTSLAPYGRPGGWNDMSLLLTPGMGSGANLMSKERHRAQFGLHCVFNANALMTGNLSTLDEYVLATWGNPEAVAINQDTAHTFVVLPLPASGEAAPRAALTPARVAECGGEPSAQAWSFDAPAAGYIRNNASGFCLNIANCQSEMIYDGCVTSGATCNPPGHYFNEQFLLSADGALVSALPGARCATVAADGSVALAACQSPLPAAQSWRHEPATGALVSGGGLCLTVASPPPPPALDALLVGRALSDGSWALLALNNRADNASLVCDAACFAALGVPPGAALHVHDVWARAPLPDATATSLAVPVAANGSTAFLRLSLA